MISWVILNRNISIETKEVLGIWFLMINVVHRAYLSNKIGKYMYMYNDNLSIENKIKITHILVG